MSLTRTATPVRPESRPHVGAPIQIRASQRQKDLIDSACSLLGKTRSEFMLETACREAEAVILDQPLMQMDRKEYKAFAAMLDAPPQPRPGLARLFSLRSPWER